MTMDNSAISSALSDAKYSESPRTGPKLLYRTLPLGVVMMEEKDAFSLTYADPSVAISAVPRRR